MIYSQIRPVTAMSSGARDTLLVFGNSTVGAARHDAKSHPGPVVADVSAAPPGVLDVSIRRRGNVIELRLAGALDAASAPRFGEAMALARVMASTPNAAYRAAARDCRRGHAATIVIDTSDIVDVDASGYRALQESLVGPNGLWDRGVAWIVGPAVAMFEASALRRPGPSTRDRDDDRRWPDPATSR
jgi:anti-anti-sigma regulatory factor